jgi:hypothetical protein
MKEAKNTTKNIEKNNPKNQSINKTTVKSEKTEPRLSDEIIKKLEEVISLDATISEACYYANISRQTYYNHVRADAPEGSEPKKLFDRFESLRNKPLLLARQTIVKNLIHPEHSKWYLEKKASKEFGNKSETIIRGGLEQDAIEESEKKRLNNLF